MNLIGKTVVHKQYGEGVVKEQDGDRIIVKFGNPGREIKIGVSVAIGMGLLRLKDTADMEIFKAQLAEEGKAARKKTEDERAKSQQRIIERANSTTKVARSPRSRNNGNTNPTTHTTGKHLLFKCNYCDGSANANSIGFKGVCSDEQIKHNIENYSGWCAHPNCPCYQYKNGKITRTQLENTHTNGNFTCYESGMLTSWMAAAGEDKDGKPRKILYAKEDKIAVLSTVLPNDKEENRVIFAVFLIGRAFVGDDVQSGYVVGKEGYTIELTPDEANHLRFWDYYSNKDKSKVWKQGLFHYATKDVIKKILEDIIKISSTNAKIAQNLLAYA